MRFTDRFIASLRAAEKRVEHADEGCKGLAIRVTPAGKKTWAYRYKRAGVMRRITLGEYPTMSLAQATIAADKRRADLLEGRNPIAERQREDSAARNVADELTFDRLSDRYLEEYAKPRKKSWKDDEWILKKARREFGRDIVSTIGRKRYVQFLRKLALKSVRNCNKAQAAICTMLNWANLEDETILNPLARLPKIGGKEREEDRILSEAELKHVWCALIDDESPLSKSTGVAVRLIFLTAQRPIQVSGMRLDELVDLDGDEPRWDLPAERMKRPKPHSVPLSKAAVEQIKLAISLRPKEQNDSPFVFPAPVNTRKVDQTPKAIDRAALGKAVLRLRKKLKMAEWSPHDGRRSATTFARAMGISRDVMEALTHHAVPGMARVYDRYDLMAEKREAVDAIASYIEKALVARPPEIERRAA